MPKYYFLAPAAVMALATVIVALSGFANAQEQRPVAHEHFSSDRMAQRFLDLFDTDDNGTVSLDEITAEEGRLFVAADVDGDGTFSVDEFRRRGHLFQQLRATTIFDMMDVNGDRMLTQDEITAPSARWFGRYDLNGDGAMDAEEVPGGGPRRCPPAPLDGP